MIYADYAATTPVDDEVLALMLPFFSQSFANASSVHTKGRDASSYVENARKIISDIFNCNKNEIYFTSGGTESDNWAIKGYVEENDVKHVITSQIEHHAVLNTCLELEKKGVRVTYLPVDETGLVDLNRLEESICKDTGLISIMTANNEIGTVQDINKIGEIAKKFNIPFHTDAVQAAGNMNIDVKKSNISMMSVSAHKFFGPKGIGVLYVKNGIKIKNMLYGGAQEKDKRPGTVNTPLVVGMVAALKKASDNIFRNNEITRERAEIIKTYVLNNLDNVYVNGNADHKLSGTISMTFKGIQAEGLLVLLDMKGICVSAGAACSAGAVKTSHVIQAINKHNEGGTIRISICHLTTVEEAEQIAENIVEAVRSLRNN